MFDELRIFLRNKLNEFSVFALKMSVNFPGHLFSVQMSLPSVTVAFIQIKFNKEGNGNIPFLLKLEKNLFLSDYFLLSHIESKPIKSLFVKT